MASERDPKTGPYVRLLTGGDLELSFPFAFRISGALPRALFVALALKPGERVSRDYLADLLWPDTDQASARQRLRMALLNLRKAMGPEARAYLESSDDNLSLGIQPGDTDLVRFSERAALQDPVARELYHGDLLSGFPSISETFDALLSREREKTRDIALTLAVGTLQNCASQDDAQGFEVAFQWAHSLDPTSHDALDCALNFHARRGNVERVTEIFRRHTRALEEIFGVPPSQELNAFFKDMERKARQVRADARAPVTEEVLMPPPPGQASAVPSSPPRGKRALPYVAGAFAFAIAALCLAAWLLYDKYWVERDHDSTLFLVRPYQIHAEDCRIPDIGDRYDRISLGALRGIEDAYIVLGPDRWPSDPGTQRVFTLEQSVVCSDRSLRVTLTLIREPGQTVEWVGRYEVKDVTLEGLGGFIASDIEGATRR